ncbi:hypothetical protein M758_UG035000 [Ceratodon purpureus]|nr:hypothetical protein M758_UG035000 [Ceratodon purpureus]
MDPGHPFLRAHPRLSGIIARCLTRKFRTALECVLLFNALMLLLLLVVMHVNFVAQPGCAEHFPREEIAGAQLVQIKITGSWNRMTEDALGRAVRKYDSTRQRYIGDGGSGKQFQMDEGSEAHSGNGESWTMVAAKFWLNLFGANARRSKPLRNSEARQNSREDFTAAHDSGSETRSQQEVKGEDEEWLERDVSSRPLSGTGRGPLGSALLHYFTRWRSYGISCFKRAEKSVRSFWQVWRITGWEPFTTSPKGDRRTVAWNKLDTVLVGLPENGSKMYDPTYLFSMEKGYLMMSESAKLRHNVKTINISISAQHSCFGNRWQRVLIDNFVGYDTILMNSLLSAFRRGYLYNFQTKELYNLNYLQDYGGEPVGINDYIVFKCGVFVTSLFVFFTTTMSVSFTLRETQARMLKFTVQLQHHARHRLPTYRLIFIHVVESLVFVPIMIGILFFLFEFFDDQLLAFMVLTLVWLCELFTMISVRMPLSMRFFPRFFFLYFMIFHIYFFSYAYGFSYLAFLATAAFMQHLVLFFWNRFEVPAIQLFLHRRSQIHITSSIHVSQGNHVNTISQSIRGLTGLSNLQASLSENQARLRTVSPHSEAGIPRPSQSSGTAGSETVDDMDNPSTQGLDTSRPVSGIPLSSWMGSPMQDGFQGILWRRRDRPLDALFRSSREPELQGEEASLAAATQATTQGSLFSLNRSVLPLVLGGSTSLVVPFFHDVGDARHESQDHDTPVGVDASNVSSNSSTITRESDASQTIGDGVRHRPVSNSAGEEQSQ